MVSPEHVAAQAPPVFDERPCVLQGATEKVLERVRCGTVAVPRDYADPGKGTFRIAVMVLQAAPSLDPSVAIVSLAGGPGASTIPSALPEEALAFPLDYDVVSVNPRGTKGSEPVICPDVNIFDGSFLGAATSGDQLRSSVATAMRSCLREAEAAGVTPAEMGAGVNAEDIERVRLALGYRQWNAYGTSYGAVTGIELARRHPASLRALVLDSPALGGFEPLTMAQNGDRAWLAYLAECAGSPGCDRDSAQLARRKEEVLAQLEREPRPIPVPPAFRAPGNVALLDRADLEMMTFFATYRREGILSLPSLIEAAANGPDDLVVQNFMGGMLNGAISLFAMAAGHCRDGAADNWAALDTKAAPVRGYQLIITAPETCGAWSAQQSAPVFPESHTVPTLVLSGGLDPITGPANARLVAVRLGAPAWLLEFPGVGHAVGQQSACARPVIDEFMRSLTPPVAHRCFGEAEATSPSTPGAAAGGQPADAAP